MQKTNNKEGFVHNRSRKTTTFAKKRFFLKKLIFLKSDLDKTQHLVPN